MLCPVYFVIVEYDEGYILDLPQYYFCHLTPSILNMSLTKESTGRMIIFWPRWFTHRHRTSQSHGRSYGCWAKWSLFFSCHVGISHTLISRLEVYWFILWQQWPNVPIFWQYCSWGWSWLLVFLYSAIWNPDIPLPLLLVQQEYKHDEVWITNCLLKLSYLI